MKLIPLLLLPLAACGPHVYVKGDHHVEMDHSDRAAVVDHAPDHGGDGDDHNGWSSDANGGVSDKTSDKNEDRPSKDHSDDSNGNGSDD